MGMEFIYYYYFIWLCGFCLGLPNTVIYHYQLCKPKKSDCCSNKALELEMQEKLLPIMGFKSCGGRLLLPWLGEFTGHYPCLVLAPYD